MFQDPDFVQQYIDRWFELRQTTFSNENLFATIDKHAAELGDAADRDYARWGRSRYGDFDGEINHLKDWLKRRVEWIDDRQDYGEVRIIAIGAVGPDILTVVYTWRGNRRRIIRQLQLRTLYR